MKLSSDQIASALGPDLFGRTCIDRAIEALRMYEPPEGYFLAFSGGKDSIVIKQLAIEAGVKFEAHYHMTTVDPPEVVQFIRQHHADVIMDRPPMTFWRLLETEGLPIRRQRFCCRVLKEGGGKGRFVVDGIRAAEPAARAARSRNGYTEVCRKDPTKRFLHAIIDWSDDQVWAFIYQRGIPYCHLYDEGYKRLGCVVCPMERQVARSMEKWPRLWSAAERAAARYYDSHPKAHKSWPTAKAMWEWWLDRDASLKDLADDPDCIGLFSSGMETTEEVTP